MSKYIPDWRGRDCPPSKVAKYKGDRKPSCHGGMGCFACAKVYNDRQPQLGRVNAPGYWMRGNYLKKVTGVFERQGTYANQADIHWERDEGGLHAVMKVYIKEDANARLI